MRSSLVSPPPLPVVFSFGLAHASGLSELTGTFSSRGKALNCMGIARGGSCAAGLSGQSQARVCGEATWQHGSKH